MNYIQILYLCILKQPDGRKKNYSSTLWITFKSCIFAFWNNTIDILLLWLYVVNYIQILYLCILKQPYNFVFRNDTMLWITFKSCIFAFWNNRFLHLRFASLVVNYIQILYLCILKQPEGAMEANIGLLWITFKSCIFAFWNNLDMFLWLGQTCCELHSNLVSLHSETTPDYDIRTDKWVVNYIQILYLCILKQPVCLYTWAKISLWITFKSCIFAFWNNQFIYESPQTISCELHSNLVSLHSETTCSTQDIVAIRLWITFKSCIFAFWNNPYQLWSSWKQGCELHSNLVSLHSETTDFRNCQHQ